MKKAINTVFVLCGLLTVGGVMGGCGGGGKGTVAVPSEATRSAPPKLFGTWTLVQTTGGITGQGYPVTPGMETLTFNLNGIVTRTVRGQSPAQYDFTVTVRKTLLTEGELPVITYTPSTLNEIIYAVDDKTLQLADEANDGYGRTYERVTTSP